METIARIFPNPLARGFTAGGERYDAVNYSRWTRVALGVTNIRRRTFRSRLRDSFWHSEGSGANAAWNDARLRDGHCAVDPKKIPYGSEVVFYHAECVAVDSGPDVVNRKAARLCGRTAADRRAIVIDRFFEKKQNALAWAKRIRILW